MRHYLHEYVINHKFIPTAREYKSVYGYQVSKYYDTMEDFVEDTIKINDIDVAIEIRVTHKVDYDKLQKVKESNLNIIVGPNGIGKTNILESIYFLLSDLPYLLFS